MVPFLILVSFYSHLPTYEDGTECSETSVYKIQTPGNYPKQSIQHTEHGESLKLRRLYSATTHAIALFHAGNDLGGARGTAFG